MELLCVLFCAGRLWRCTRQSETKNGAAVRIGTGPKTAMVRLDNSTADIQPHTQAFRLGAVKRFKQTLRITQAVTAINNGDLDQRVLICDYNMKYAVITCFHCFHP